MRFVHAHAPAAEFLNDGVVRNAKKAGPLLVALDHRGTGDGKPLRIFFTDVAVKLAGSDTWVPAQ